MSSQYLPDPQFETLLDYLRFIHGFDFTGRKHASRLRQGTCNAISGDIKQRRGVVLMMETQQDEKP
jgi:hypothetical protein